MYTLRGVISGFLLWILIFVEISITSVGLKMSESSVWLTHYILLVPFTLLCSWLYYRSKDKLNGLAVGLFFLLIGIILDFIITVPFFIIPQGGSYLSYFYDPKLFVGFLVVLIISGVYDLFRKKDKVAA